MRKTAIFQPLMRGNAKQHGCLHIGANLVAKLALGQMGLIHPISTCIWGKSANFFKIRVFPATNVGLCVHGPCKTAGDLQNTPGTPAMHFPLVVAGSQSALYEDFSEMV